MRPGREADPSSPSSAEVKNRVELYLYSPKGLCGLWKGETFTSLLNVLYLIVQVPGILR